MQRGAQLANQRGDDVAAERSSRHLPPGRGEPRPLITDLKHKAGLVRPDDDVDSAHAVLRASVLQRVRDKLVQDQPARERVGEHKLHPLELQRHAGVRIQRRAQLPEEDARIAIKINAREVLPVVQLLVDQRHRADAIRAVEQHFSRLGAAHCVRLQPKQARHDLEVVLHAMVDLLQERHLLGERVLKGLLCGNTLADIDGADQRVRDVADLNATDARGCDDATPRQAGPIERLVEGGDVCQRRRLLHPASGVLRLRAKQRRKMRRLAGFEVKKLLGEDVVPNDRAAWVNEQQRRRALREQELELRAQRRLFALALLREVAGTGADGERFVEAAEQLEHRKPNQQRDRSDAGHDEDPPDTVDRRLRPRVERPRGQREREQRELGAGEPQEECGAAREQRGGQRRPDQPQVPHADRPDDPEDHDADEENNRDDRERTRAVREGSAPHPHHRQPRDRVKDRHPIHPVLQRERDAAGRGDACHHHHAAEDPREHAVPPGIEVKVEVEVSVGHRVLSMRSRGWQASNLFRTTFGRIQYGLCAKAVPTLARLQPIRRNRSALSMALLSAS